MTIVTEVEVIKADVINVIPPMKAGQIAMTLGLTDARGGCPLNRRNFASTLLPAGLAAHLHPGLLRLMKATTMNTTSLSLPWKRLATACLLIFLSYGASATQTTPVAPQQVAPPHAAHAPQAAATAWTPATLRQTLASLPKGDASAGQQMHLQLFCASCHMIKKSALTLTLALVASLGFSAHAADAVELLVTIDSGSTMGQRAHPVDLDPDQTFW
jgi:hypothetical protein